MTNTKIDLDLVFNEYKSFPDKFDSMQMATISKEGIPNASYAAYVKKDKDFYIYISELSTHTQDIKETGQVSVLFIENENHAKHLFARKRLTFHSEAFEISRDSDDFKETMNAFVTKFGKFITMLREVKDFHLYKIHPVSGTFVQGFGKAFSIKGDSLDQISHINDKGHKTPNRKTELEMDHKMA